MNQKVLVLAGSGEFTKSMEETDKFLLSQIENPVVAIIPTAAGQEDDYFKWIDNGVTHFQKLGAEVFGVHLLERKDAESDEKVAELSRANFYYFSGGDPGYLLDSLKNTKVWQLIVERYNSGDAILAGSSAGAMVMGKKVIARIYRFFRTGELPEWEDGLGLVDFAVIPHFDKLSEDMSEEHIRELKTRIPPDVKIIGIDEDTAFIKIDANWQTLGKGKVHDPAF